MNRVPIKVARDIAKANRFRQVILTAWDGERTHIVTYGVSTEDCAQAALGWNKIKAALGCPKKLDAEPSRVLAMQARIASLRDAVLGLIGTNMFGTCTRCEKVHKKGTLCADLKP